MVSDEKKDCYQSVFGLELANSKGSIPGNADAVADSAFGRDYLIRSRQLDR